MDPELFRQDIDSKPAFLRGLAERLRDDDPWEGVDSSVTSVTFVGMGSSTYAAEVGARRLRAHGRWAVAEWASARTVVAPPGGVVVAISASGGSLETLEAVDRLSPGTRVLALTNRPESALAQRAERVVALSAGPEAGGVASVSFLHTVVQLLALEARLTDGSRSQVADLCLRAADATEALLSSRDTWLPRVDELLAGPDGVSVLAPVERWSSAAQSALMLREGPRVPAVACETADWAHVDVYLTKTRDYRALVLGGSAYDGQAVDWLRQRGSTVVAVGGLLDSDLPRHTVRYPDDSDPEVALLTEVTVAEVLAATWWARSRG